MTISVKAIVQPQWVLNARVTAREAVALAILCLLSTSSPAQEDRPEFLGLKDIPEARVMRREYRPDQDYTLVLSTFKKVDGAWIADREQRVSGDLSRRTLELVREYSAREAYQFYREQLAEFPVRELFVCRERECGGSINWANNHFNVIQLYGLDEHQYYGVYEVSARDAVFYASLYTVRRGNRRVYVQLDLVRTPKTDGQMLSSNPATFRHNLAESHFFVLPGFEVTGTEDEWSVSVPGTTLEALAAVLRQEPDWRLALVGHDYAAKTVAAQQAQSLEYAEKVRAALTARGVSEGRLSVYGLGSLAPAGRGERSARVEVVRLPQQ